VAEVFNLGPGHRRAHRVRPRAGSSSHPPCSRICTRAGRGWKPRPLAGRSGETVSRLEIGLRVGRASPPDPAGVSPARRPAAAFGGGTPPTIGPGGPTHHGRSGDRPSSGDHVPFLLRSFTRRTCRSHFVVI